MNGYCEDKMSRTFRKKSYHFKYTKKETKKGMMRDGSETRSISSCENHGGCSYCTRNRIINRLKIDSKQKSDFKEFLTTGE